MKKVESAPLWASPVLYVEDEVLNWEVAELRLKSRFALQWARSAEEACTKVRLQKGDYLAILMDIQLTGSALDGIQLTRALRGKLDPNTLPQFAHALPMVTCPIFFVTAYGDLYLGPPMNDSGGDGWLPKPIDFVKLLTLLARANAMRAVASLKPPA